MKYIINQVNWPGEYPYCPEASVEVKNDHEWLYLHFRVKGEQLRAVTTADQGPVWEDSCVEFFVKEPDSPYYRGKTRGSGSAGGTPAPIPGGSSGGGGYTPEPQPYRGQGL